MLKIIRREAHFLYVPSGRGAFYVLCGLVTLGKFSLMTLLIGLYCIVVGVLVFTSSKKAEEELQNIQAMSLDDAVIYSQFRDFDTDGDGKLSAQE